MKFALRLLVAGAVLAGTGGWARAEEVETFTRVRDVIYGRKAGLALTMDVFKPKENANGAAVVLVISGGYFSAPEAINPAFSAELLKRGYTVFAVVHGSQPKFTVPEIVPDVHRAVRFIRHHVKDHHIDPNRIGVGGASAGGHLSLMLGTAGTDGDPKAKDPVDRVSSRVQAVACFFPPTDLLNYGAKGKEMLGAAAHAPPFRPAFDYHELDQDRRVFVRIEDKAKLRAVVRDISPLYYVTPDDAPTLLIHGDKDDVVPLQQSETIVEKFKEAKVPARLIVKPGAGHGWLTILNEMKDIADWFDLYLAKQAQ